MSGVEYCAVLCCCCHLPSVVVSVVDCARVAVEDVAHLVHVPGTRSGQQLTHILRTTSSRRGTGTGLACEPTRRTGGGRGGEGRQAGEEDGQGT